LFCIFNHLDDAAIHSGIRRLSARDRALGFGDRRDCLIEQLPLVLERLALRAQRVREPARRASGEGADLLERHADELQRDDLFQPLQVARRVRAIASGRPFRLQQPEAVVVVQGAGGDAGQPRERGGAIGAGVVVGHGDPVEKMVRPDAVSRSTCVRLRGTRAKPST
jgi:hypothetical protein